MVLGVWVSGWRVSGNKGSIYRKKQRELGSLLRMPWGKLSDTLVFGGVEPRRLGVEKFGLQGLEPGQGFTGSCSCRV